MTFNQVFDPHCECVSLNIRDRIGYRPSSGGIKRLRYDSRLEKSHQILSSVFIALNDISKKEGMHYIMEPNKVAKLASKITSKPMTSVCLLTE